MQHLSIIDYVCVSADMDGRITEYSDHLHEHMVTPVQMQNGRYMPPTDSGYSVQFTPDALNRFSHSPPAV